MSTPCTDGCSPTPKRAAPGLRLSAGARPRMCHALPAPQGSSAGRLQPGGCGEGAARGGHQGPAHEAELVVLRAHTPTEAPQGVHPEFFFFRAKRAGVIRAVAGAGGGAFVVLATRSKDAAQGAQTLHTGYNQGEARGGYQGRGPRRRWSWSSGRPWRAWRMCWRPRRARAACGAWS